MYKRIILIALALMPLVTIAQNDDAAAVHKVLDDQVTYWNKGDVVTFMKGYWNSDSVMFVTKNGPVYGYQTVLAHYKKSFPNKAAMGDLTFSGLILKRLSSEYYFVVGAFHLKGTANLDGNFTLLFRKIGGAWKIIVDHSS
jgi:ketosteroid isomerase-like protein